MGSRTKGDEITNEEERDAARLEMQLKIAKMRTDIHWIERILTVICILLAALLGIEIPEAIING